LRHYEATGKKYPLVVKLGTITPHGADVYSYAEDEDDMVLDPHLVSCRLTYFRERAENVDNENVDSFKRCPWKLLLSI
jgi:uncharacterized UBP type Zn finger protein